MVTSIGVAIGVGLVVLTGYLVLDPILAAATGVYVLWSGMAMISAVGRRPDGRGAGARRGEPHPRAGGRERRRRASRRMTCACAMPARLTFLEFHLVVPGSMTVAESHAICDHIEEALQAEMQHLMITIHVEPEEKAKQHGVPVL